MQPMQQYSGFHNDSLKLSRLAGTHSRCDDSYIMGAIVSKAILLGVILGTKKGGSNNNR